MFPLLPPENKFDNSFSKNKFGISSSSPSHSTTSASAETAETSKHDSNLESDTDSKHDDKNIDMSDTETTPKLPPKAVAETAEGATQAPTPIATPVTPAAPGTPPASKKSEKEQKLEKKLSQKEAKKSGTPPIAIKVVHEKDNLDEIGPETPFLDTPDKNNLKDIPLDDTEKADTPDGPLPVFKNVYAKALAMSLFSALYALLLVIFALVFECSVIISPTVIHASKYDAFYLYLYILSIVFMAYVQLFLFKTRELTIPGKKVHVPLFNKDIGVPDSVRKTVADIQVSIDSKGQKVSHSAPAAGSLFLRLGMLMFGVVAIIYYGLELYSCAAQQDCTGWKQTTLVFGCFFMFIQSYFIFQNAKIVIHRFKHVGKLGMMHLVATNICVWLKLIFVEDFLTQTENRNITDFNMVSMACKEEERKHNVECYLADFKPVLITGLVEYSLVCAVIAYIMWRNIGCCPAEESSARRLGFRVDCRSTTRGLFAGILYAVIVVITLIVFFLRVYFLSESDVLWTFYLADALFYGVAFGGVVLAVVAVRSLPFVGVSPEVESMILLDDILLVAGLVGQLLFSILCIVSLPEVSEAGGIVLLSSLLRTTQVLFQTAFIFAAQRIRCVGPELQTKRPGRELVAFLLVVNLSLFLVNAFEVQKAISNPVMMNFYGQRAWAIIVHAAVPLTVFYRFQSSVCLAEVWKLAYRVKQE